MTRFAALAGEWHPKDSCGCPPLPHLPEPRPSPCRYKYSMEIGDRVMPRNTPFELVPDSWVCPNCNSPKAFFVRLL